MTICGLIAQSEVGDASNSANLLVDGTCSYPYADLVENLTDNVAELSERIANEHKKLAGMKCSTAEYKMLQVVSKLSQYGMVFHEAKNCEGLNIQIGVGPKGLEIFDENFVTIEK